MPDKAFTKFSVSLPPKLAQYVQSLVDAEEINSRSAYIAELVRKDLKRREKIVSDRVKVSDTLERVLDELKLS